MNKFSEVLFRARTSSILCIFGKEVLKPTFIIWSGSELKLEFRKKERKSRNLTLNTQFKGCEKKIS